MSALCVVALGWPLTAAAQMGGGMGGHGGHGNRGSRPSTATSNSSIATTVDVPNPLRTMLGEMRKLRVDLLLTSAQIEPWSKMEDALRECVDLEHSRRPTLRAGVQVDAEGYIQAIADNERALADAENRFAGATKIALATLNPRQLQTTRDRFASAISDAQSPTLATP
ncbi:MAG: hypothetical protein JSR65_03690 [Proteobacteria bacterium]|nr:hypothetical protein [Pseudomonadota bacterium]